MNKIVNNFAFEPSIYGITLRCYPSVDILPMRQESSVSRLKILAIALMLVPASGHAYDIFNDGFDLSPEATRHLSDPAFLPLEGQLTSGTSYGVALAHKNLGNFYSQEMEKIRTNFVEQGFSYGVSDRLSLNASITYEQSREKDDYWQPDYFYGGSYSYEDRFYSDGFTNPRLGAVYRVIDQRENPLSVDASVTYWPDLFPARYATTYRGGTVASGGHTVAADVAVSRQMKIFTIQGIVGTDFYGNRKITAGPGVFDDYVVEKHSVRYGYHFTLNSQTRLTDLFSIDAGFGVSGVTGNHISDDLEGAYFDAKNGPTLLSQIALNSFLIKDRLYVRFEFDREWQGDTKEAGIAYGGWLPVLGTTKNPVVNQYVMHLGALLF